MTIATYLTTTRDALAEWAQSYGGTCEVATDPLHLFALITTKPGGVRAVVMYAEEQKRGEHEEAGFVDRTMTVVISRGRGFTLQPGDSLITGAASGPALFDLVEEARDIVRGINFTVGETEWTADYKGTRVYQVVSEGAQVMLDAYQLDFALGTQLPVPTGPGDYLVFGDGAFFGLGTNDVLGLTAA